MADNSIAVSKTIDMSEREGGRERRERERERERERVKAHVNLVVEFNFFHRGMQIIFISSLIYNYQNTKCRRLIVRRSKNKSVRFKYARKSRCNRYINLCEIGYKWPIMRFLYYLC